MAFQFKHSFPDVNLNKADCTLQNYYYSKVYELNYLSEMQETTHITLAPNVFIVPWRETEINCQLFLFA